MTDQKSPLDRALDVFVFAPVGALVSARELLPKLVDRGRQQVTGQVTMARMIGEFAVRQGQVEAEKTINKARQQAADALENLGRLNGGAPSRTVPDPVAQATPAPSAPAAATDGAAAATVTAPPAPTQEAGPRRATDNGSAPAVSADELGIPDYDSLSASQVIPRLAGLSTAELEAVRAYESAHRCRKTILSRVAQLQGQ